MNDKNKDSGFLDAIYKHSEEQKAELRRDVKNYKKDKKEKPAKSASVQAFQDVAKETKFFDAINEDAQEQMAAITREIEAYRSEKIEQATEQGLQDAYDLIHEDLTRRTAAIVNDAAKRQLVLRNSLYQERQLIRDEVFAQAKEKLITFTKTADYAAFLTRSLHQIGEKAGSDKCLVSIAPADEDKRALIGEKLAGAEIVVDNHILIGGLRAHIPSQGILLDDTLDTRLNDQYAWFYENSGLKVV